MAKRIASPAPSDDNPPKINTSQYLTQYSKANIEAIEQYTKSGNQHRDYSNLVPGISGRPGLSFEDYYSFRPEEQISQTFSGIFKQADEVYNKCGLIWNIINLMTDFTTKGIRVVHRNKRKEKIAREWFARIEGLHVSERFTNYFYRLGNVVALRYTAKIKNEDQFYTQGAADLESFPAPSKTEKKVIPWRYVFLHPASCDIVGGELSRFVEKPIYAIKFSTKIKRQVLSPKTEEDKKIVAQLPQDMVNAIKNSKSYTLPEDKVIVYHFKKDDWQPWALPITYPILTDINILQKLKLADVCALESAASKIRIFRLGVLESYMQVPPDPNAVSKFASFIENSVGGGTIDVIWGKDVDIIETDLSNAAAFLGEEKYKPTLNNIYTTMGVPITLTSTYSGGAGASGSQMSLKTLTERLHYGRTNLLDFWQAELEMFAKALGWKEAPQIEFDQTILANEDTEKQLLIQLADRNLISDETLQLKFNLNPDMEQIRTNRENKERTSGRRVNKAGQWFDPQHKEKLTQIALQSGSVTPSQVGLELPDPKPKEISQITKLQQKGAGDQKKNPGVSGKGRPGGKKDSKKRKTPKFSTRAADLAWAIDAQKQINDILQPAILKGFGKANIRKLTYEEYNQAEKIKFDVLCGLKPFEAIDLEKVDAIVKAGLSYDSLKEEISTQVHEYRQQTNTEPTIDQIRLIQAEVYLSLYTKE